MTLPYTLQLVIHSKQGSVLEQMLVRKYNILKMFEI